MAHHMSYTQLSVPCCLVSQQVLPAAGGGCRIEHILAVKPVMEIPAAIAPYTSSIFKQQVGKLLQDLEHAIDRQLAAKVSAN